MRPIPPDVWVLAVAVGHLQRAIDEKVKNALLTHNLFILQWKIDSYLEQSRKEKRK